MELYVYIDIYCFLINDIKLFDCVCYNRTEIKVQQYRDDL